MKFKKIISLLLIIPLGLALCSFDTSNAECDEEDVVEIYQEEENTATIGLEEEDLEVYESYVSYTSYEITFDDKAAQVGLGKAYDESKAKLIENNVQLMTTYVDSGEYTIDKGGNLVFPEYNAQFNQQFNISQWKISWGTTTFVLDGQMSMAIGIISILFKVAMVSQSYFANSNDVLAKTLGTAMFQVIPNAASSWACDQVVLYASSMINIVMGIEGFLFVVSAGATGGLSAAGAMVLYLASWVVNCYLPSIISSAEMIAYGYRGCSYKGTFGIFASNYSRI